MPRSITIHNSVTCQQCIDEIYKQNPLSRLYIDGWNFVSPEPKIKTKPFSELLTELRETKSAKALSNKLKNI